MIVTIQPLHLIWFVGLGITFMGAFVGLGKWMLAQFQARIEDRFALLAEDARSWRQQEIRLMELRNHVSEHYVRREDWVRGQSVIEAKLDALAARMEASRHREGK